jgi:Ca2+-dependent lipid-binding protein
MCHLVASAHDIVWTGKKKSPNLYVEVKVDELTTQSTQVIQRKRSPVWNEEFIVYVY